MESKLEKNLFRSILIIFILIIIIIYSDVKSNLREGMQIPDFKIYTMKDEIVTKNDIIGKTVLINFWATWCPPCVEELPLFMKMQQKYKGKDVILMLVNVGEKKEDIESFLRENKLSIDVYRDPDKEVSKTFGTYKYPETYIIDRNGILKKKIIGSITWVEGEIWGYLDKVIGEETKKQ